MVVAAVLFKLLTLKLFSGGMLLLLLLPGMAEAIREPYLVTLFWLIPDTGWAEGRGRVDCIIGGGRMISLRFWELARALVCLTAWIFFSLLKIEFKYIYFKSFY